MTTKRALKGMLIAFILLFPISYFLNRNGMGFSIEKSLMFSFVFSIVIVGAFTLLIWVCWKILHIFLQTDYVASAQKVAQERSKNEPVSKSNKILNPNSFPSILVGLLAPILLVGMVVLVNDLIITSLFGNSHFLNQTIFVPSARAGSSGHDGQIHFVIAVILSLIEIKFFFWGRWKKFMQKIGVYQRSVV